jgi:outer membrane protein assembly factor BamB
MRRHSALLVPSLLALAMWSPAAELDWSAVPDGAPPAAWAVHAPAAASVRWSDGALELAANSNQGVSASTALDGRDGSDAEPLRLSAIVSADGERAVDGHPVVLAVQWSSGAVFAVGLGEDPHTRRDERRAWAMWNGSGKSGIEHAEAALGDGATPAHLRIVVTSSEVAAYGSRDGWTWTRVAGIARSAVGAEGPPQRLLVGRGTIGGAAGLAGDLPSDGRGRPCRYRFAALRVEHGPSDLPASLLRSYAKQESLGDTLDAIAEPGRPRLWRLRGPEPAGRNWPPTRLAEQNDGWSEHRLGDNERVLQLGRLLPGGNDQVRWAETTLTMPASGWQRLLFDGTRQCWLWVDGRLVSSPDRERDEAEPDRQAALVWLAAGEHRVTLALRGGRERAAAILRWESGDARYRIALLRRLLIDFPDDEGLHNAPFEIARLWEGNGFSQTAATSLAELAARSDGGEMVERALVERARLFRHLRDETAAAAEIANLSRRWEAGEADKLATAVRTARLWQRLDVPERALGALTEALALPDLPASTRCELTIERARMQRRQGDARGMAGEIAAAAQHLPADDERAAELLALAVRSAAQAGGEVAAAVERLSALATDTLRCRLLAGAHAARGDAAARLAARRRAAALPADGLDAPAIDLAEQIAVTDAPGALTLYRQELARLGVAAPAALPAARTAHLAAVLAERRAGARLVAAAAAIPAAQATALSWHLAGPLPMRDWKAHEMPPAEVLRGPEGGPVGGQQWRAVTPELMQGDTVDLNRTGMGDNAVVYLATTISSADAATMPVAISADDALAVWLNGERIYADRTQRGIDTESVALRLALRPGANLLVCSVQNGGGASAFRFQARREPWPQSEVARALQGAAGGAAERAAAGIALARLAEAMLREGQSDTAVALARAVIRCWPDDPQLQWRLAGQVLYERAWSAVPGHLAEVSRWYDAHFADRAWDNADQQAQVRGQLNERLVEAGLASEALARLQRAALTELDPGPLAQVHLRESDLWLRFGSPRLAVAAAVRARAAAAGDEMLEAEADRRISRARSIKGELVTVPTPFEIGNLLRTAERAATSGDAERAAADWQKAIEDGRDQPVAVAQGRIRGAAQFAAGRLRQAGAAVLEAWHLRHDARAAKALDKAITEADPVALERVAERWPLAPAATQALSLAAGAWLAQGDWHLAQGAAQACLDIQPPGQPRALLVRAAHAAMRAGDAAAFSRHAAALVKIGGSSVWDGVETPVSEILERLRRLRPGVAQPDPRSVGLSIQTSSARVAGAALPHGDGLLFASLDEVALIAGDGTLRWRVASEAYADPGTTHPSQAQVVAALASSGDRAVAVQLHQGVRRLVAVQVSTGQVSWISGDNGGLASMAAVSAPLLAGNRVYGWFADRSRAVVACLDARDGTVLWSSTCGTGPLRQPIADGIELDLGGDAPAPLLSGRDLFVATDAGQVACYDAVHGSLRWIRTYPRTALPGPEGSTAVQLLMQRERSPLAAGGRHLFVAPRDSLALLAIDRVNGALAWSAELADVREIVGATEDALITAGDGLTCFDPATGSRRWRWLPAAEAPRRLGRPALVGDAVWTATTQGLHRIALGDGSASPGPTWQALGISGEPPAWLLAAEGRLIACGRSGALVLGGAERRIQAVMPPRSAVQLTGAQRAGSATPVAVGAMWELIGGQAQALVRPFDAQPGECYALTGGQLLRLDALTGTVVWATSVAYGVAAELQVVGKHILLRDGMDATVWERSHGALCWQRRLDPDPVRSLRSDWQPLHIRLDARGVAMWRWRDSWFAVHGLEDGQPVLRGRVDGGVIGVVSHADEVHVALWRNRGLHVEIRSRSSGERISLVPLGIEGTEQGASLSLDDGSLLIAARQGAVLWRPADRAVHRLDLGMEELSTSYRSGGRWIIVGRADEGRYISAVLDAAKSTLLSRQVITQHWSSQWQERIPFFEHMVGDLRVRSAVRNDRTGVLGQRLDGAEAFWLAPVETRRRSYHAVVPLGERAVAIAIDRDGTVRGQLVNPRAGTIEAESVLSAMPAWPPVRPIEVDGLAVIATVRGLCAIAPLATPPLPAAQPVTAVKAERAPVVDGQLDDWPALTAGQSVQAQLAWNDDALFCALRTAAAAGEIGRLRFAVDLGNNEYRPGDPLLLALDWDDGAARPRVLSSAVAEDPARSPIQARAAASPSGVVWELRIPWIWLRENGRRPGREDPLRVGAALWPADGSPVREWGDGLGRGLDPSRLLRVRLEDGRK